MFDSSGFDLRAYLDRLGHHGRVAPDLETLRAIALRHPLTIPFENLDPLLGRPVTLDTSSLQRKLVQQGRGGYCYEHNLLLGTALRAIGFNVDGLAARVMWNHPPGSSTPRSHMVLLVDVDGSEYAVDAGFGGLTLTAPVRLETDVEQPTPHEPCRLTRAGGEYVMQVRVGSEWKSMYRFDLQRQALVDYEVTSWFLSNNPGSPFVIGLMAARVEADRRYGLRNTELSVHHVTAGEGGSAARGQSERRRLANPDELREALEQIFRIHLPPEAHAHSAFARVFSEERHSPAPADSSGRIAQLSAGDTLVP